MTIAEPIRYMARTRAAAPAVILADGAPVTYAALDRLIDGLAAALAEQGVGPGQVVGLTIGAPDEFPGLVAALALARLGAVSADPALPPQSMQFSLGEAVGAAVGVAVLRPEIVWARALVLQRGALPRPAPPAPDAPCRIFGSSGTTGAPKFIPLTHAQLALRVNLYFVTLGNAALTRICGIALGTSIGFTAMLRTLWTGGTLVLTDPARLLAAIGRHRVQSLLVAPATLQRLLAAMPDAAPPPDTLQTIEFGGAILPARLRAEVERRLCRTLVCNFGTTEVGSIASAPLAALGGDVRAVGVVVPGVRARIVDSAGAPCPPGIEGALAVRTPSMIAAYLDGDGAEAFGPHGFRTGDLGTLSADGVLRITGRSSEVINAGGLKVSPAAVEDVLLAVAGVQEAAAFGVPDGLGVIEVWAAVAGPAPVPGAALEHACRTLGVLAPRTVLQVNALPRNANGKLQREALVRAALQYRDGATGAG